MRTLILLRHAHAEPAAPGQDDAERPLSALGRREAAAAGDWLRAHALLPARVLCSSARRTRETLAGLGALGAPELRLEPAIYDATAGTLMAVLEAERDADSVLLVGHNPGVEHLLALLHSGQSGDFRGMPPAAIAWLVLPDQAVIEPGVARLREFWWP